MLVDLNIKEFINVLASDFPAPGGGSASALAGAMGVSLTAMVAALTTGKEKYSDYEETVQEIIAETNSLKKQFLDVIDRDTEAYKVVTHAYSLPKTTEDDKIKRSEAIQFSLKKATNVPYELMRLCLDALKCAEKALGKTNKNAASDLGVSALNLKSSLQGAWLNVLINLSSIKDENFVRDCKENGLKIYAEATDTADRIYNNILNSL